MCLLGSVLALVVAIQEQKPCRPWTVETTSRQRFNELEAVARIKAKGGTDSWITLAEWCADRNLFGCLQKAAEKVLSIQRESPEAHRLLGYEKSDSGWRFEELSRFTSEAPALDVTLPSADLAEELGERSRSLEFERARRAECFDLYSDLSGDRLGYYTDLLNDHYRNLKNRFQPHPGGQIKVFLFGSWSDYLRFYNFVTGRSGESVLGYYVPQARLLVFYHAPYDRDSLATVIRHECTHLLVDLSFEGASVPVWLHEGLACYLAGRGEEVSGRYTTSLLLELVEKMRTGGAPDIDRLLGLERLEYADYAASWGLLYLLNRGKRQATFRRFMGDLRDASDSASGGGSKGSRLRALQAAKNTASDLRDKARELLADRYAGSYQLKRELVQLFTKEFALTTPRQFLDLGWSALDRPEKDLQDRDRMVEVAHEAFQKACELGTGDELAEGLLGLAGCAVRQAALAEPDPVSCRLMLRHVRHALRELPHWDDEFLVARFAHEALWTLRRSMDLEPRHKVFDCRAALEEVALRRGKIEEDLGRSLVVLYDDVLRLAFEALARTLERDPLHRRAAHEWLRLAIDFVPSQLALIFPTLLALVEADPTDRNLAALATAYAGLGEAKWGRSLFEEAQRRAVKPEHIADFAPFFEK